MPAKALHTYAVQCDVILAQLPYQSLSSSYPLTCHNIYGQADTQTPQVSTDKQVNTT